MLNNTTARREMERQKPCPVCSGRDFEWGYLDHAWYQPGKRSSWRRATFNQKVVRVRRCLTCDNLQQFVDEAASQSYRRSTILGIALALGIILFLLFIMPTFMGFGFSIR